MTHDACPSLEARDSLDVYAAEAAALEEIVA